MRRAPAAPVLAVVALSFGLGLLALVALDRGSADPGLTQSASSPSEEPVPGDLLPDLDQAAPSKLVVTSATRAGRRIFRLGFASAVSNVGAGPLIVDGHRRGGARTMRADQLVVQADGSTRTLGGVALLRYVRSSDHAHWHLVPFERYELRRAGASASAARDVKTGFCLGDRYDSKRRLARKPPRKVYRGRCGLRSPHLLRVRQGISVGYGDDYDPTLEGQYVELTGLPAGRYVLVHRVNEARRLLESDYSNNAASLLLQLGWHRGRPLIRAAKTCGASEDCRG